MVSIIQKEEYILHDKLDKYKSQEYQIQYTDNRILKKYNKMKNNLLILRRQNLWLLVDSKFKYTQSSHRKKIIKNDTIKTQNILKKFI